MAHAHAHAHACTHTHTACVSTTLLHDVSTGRIISNIWPPWSHDLTSLIYQLWGAMKGAVYKDNSHTLLELKKAIVNFIRNITLNCGISLQTRLYV
jgi:hypothetical protein